MAPLRSPEATAASVMAIILRKQARYCHSLAARNADLRISAALSRMGRRLSAEARRSVGKCTTRLPMT